MNGFDRIVLDIKSLKIQGAENIAKASLDALEILAKRRKTFSHEQLMHDFFTAKKELFLARATEPCLRNAVNFVLYGLHTTKDYYDSIDMLEARIQKAREHFSDVKKKITTIGEKKISNHSIVFTHCHSSTVIDILIAAKLNKKHFIVHNTETRPKFQGRITAKELSDAGILVEHFVDSGARYALKKADLMLIGADAITSEGKVINKIGSELFVEVANQYQIPIYVCTDSWKFDPLSVFGYEEEIEVRSPDEVWKERPKNVKINNYAFEKINPDLITGIISELGVYKPEVFLEEVKRNYPWMFTSSFS